MGRSLWAIRPAWLDVNRTGHLEKRSRSRSHSRPRDSIRIAKPANQATPCEPVAREQDQGALRRGWGSAVANKIADGLLFRSIRQENTSFKVFLQPRGFGPQGSAWIWTSCVSIAGLSGPGVAIELLAQPQVKRHCRHLNSFKMALGGFVGLASRSASHGSSLRCYSTTQWSLEGILASHRCASERSRGCM